MKKISLLSQLLIVLLFACKKDETLVMVNATVTPPAISAPAAGMAKIVTASNQTDQMTFTWSATGYGVASQVTYTVLLDSKCNTFSTPIVVGTSTSTSLSVALSDLNTKLIGSLHVAPNRIADLQIEVTSTLNGSQLSTSSPVELKITPYSDAPLALWLGENSTSSSYVYATSATTYEGYRNFTAPTSFRLADNPVCADSVLGSGGAGKLSTASTAPQITMPRKNGGYYKIDVDTKALTFDTTYITTWGLIGDATPQGWNNSTPMIYSAAADNWTATVALVNGALKFRANDAWDINYGPSDSNALIGTLISTDGAISIAEAGTYIVTIDFSQTKSPYTFNYTVVKSGDVAEPAKLWLPGGYEGYNPAAAPTIYAISATVFEGYVNIPSGTGFKFTSAPDYNHINYGDSGTPGVLTTDGTAPDLSLGVAGYYKLSADIQNLTYGTYLVNSWGAIGTATPGQWNSSTPMTFDATTNTWSITMDLVVGALKFRANDDWGLNYGPASSTDLLGQLIQTDASISIPADGNYTITLDFTRSAAPYQYTYTVKQN